MALRQETTRLEGGCVASGLRTRFTPRSRIAQGLISIGPWVDVVLLVLLFCLVGSKVVLKPGVVVTLPEAPFTDGTRPGLMVVVHSVGSGTLAREELVFFDDIRFRVRNEGEMQGLKLAFAKAVNDRGNTTLIIEADQRVSHGTVMALMDMASEVGVRKVNLAHKPKE